MGTTQTAVARCAFCPTGRRVPGETSVTLTRGDTTIVFRHVPAQVCDTCGEAYVDESIARELEAAAARAVDQGVTHQVSNYVSRVA